MKKKEVKKEVLLVIYYMRLSSGVGAYTRVPVDAKDPFDYVNRNFTAKGVINKYNTLVGVSKDITILIKEGDMVNLTYDDTPKVISKISEDRTHITFVDHAGAEGALMSQIHKIWFRSADALRPNYLYVCEINNKAS